MSSVRKNMFPKVAVAIGLVAVLGSSAAAAAGVHLLAPPSTAHGGGFQLEAQKDTTFCVDVDPGGIPGSALSLSVCSAAASQRWTFTSNTDGSNLLVDWSGFCVDAAGHTAGDGVALQAVNCNFAKSQRLRFTSAGSIQIGGTKNCLSFVRVASGAAITLESCSNPLGVQRFKLAQ